MKKFLIPIVLCLSFLLSSCSLFIIERKTGADTTASLSDGAPKPQYSDKVSANTATLGTLNSYENYLNQLSLLPKMDFTEKYFGDQAEDKNVYFSIATTAVAPIFSSADEISGSCVSLALNTIEDAYNVDVINQTFTPEALGEKLTASELSKTYFADLLCLDGALATKYATDDYSKKISTVPFISADSVYSNGDFFSTDSALSQYGVMNDSSYLHFKAYCLYFDPSATDTDLYSKALAGKLTWDLVYAEASAARRTVSGFGGVNDLFRLTSGARYVIESGKTVLSGEHLISAEGQSVQDALDGAYNRIFAAQSDAAPMFFVDTFGNYKEYLHNKTPYGVLPLPKWSEDAEYTGYVDKENVFYYLCPNYGASDECTGIILSALGATCSQREAEMLLEVIRDSARDNGTLLVSHILFARPSWDVDYLNVPEKPSPEVPEVPEVPENPTPEVPENPENSENTQTGV